MAKVIELTAYTRERSREPCVTARVHGGRVLVTRFAPQSFTLSLTVFLFDVVSVAVFVIRDRFAKKPNRA